MKIIKEGKKEILSKDKRFECDQCGCIFEANESEYKTEYEDCYFYHYCKCPFCENWTYTEIVLR